MAIVQQVSPFSVRVLLRQAASAAGCDLTKAEPDPESPAQPGIDTMEFRPSDAKDGEFEPKPM